MVTSAASTLASRVKPWTGTCSSSKSCAKRHAPKGVTVAQLAIAWVLTKGENIVPLIGARKRDRLDESLGALDIELGPSDVEQIERTVPSGAAAGTRYNAYLTGDLDSENA